jgi:hypothetical protein
MMAGESEELSFKIYDKQGSTMSGVVRTLDGRLEHHETYGVSKILPNYNAARKCLSQFHGRSSLMSWE